MTDLLERAEPLFREMAGSRLLITGGTGFMGRWLLESISEARVAFDVDLQVTVISRDPRRFLRRAPRLAIAPWLQFKEADLCHLNLQIESYSHLVHAATDTSADAAGRPLERIESMVVGTRKILEYASDCNIENGIFTSSGAVYGAVSESVSESGPFACDCTQSRSDYAESKRMGEMLCAIATEQMGVAMRIARCFTFAGPYLPLHGHFAIGNFIADALLGKKINVLGDGTTVRSYLYAGDLVVWLLTILLRGEPMRPYNVGSDQGVSILELARCIEERLAPGKRVQVQGHTADGKLDYYLPSITRAREELDLDVWTSLDDAIDYYANWARAKGRC